MKTIAVTYDNGLIYQHFGSTPAFKIYKVEEDQILETMIVDAAGEGHSALPAQLKELGAEVAICGGLGMGMLNALKSNGIVVCANVSGSADEAVKSFLAGTLEYNEEAHAGHGHHHQTGGETMKNEGKTVRVHYTGTFNDGTKFDSSYDRGETLEFVCGAGQMIPGFDEAVKNMEVGEIIDVHLMPEEAYGMPDPEAVVTVEIAQLAGSEDLEVGQQVYMQNQYGQPFAVVVTAKDDTYITLDANHEMAGKELNFKIELVEVVEA
jgi:FKBP-type peptidyl-prolyl cis-trans isomerase 2/predicted Fe-Mo cluster-binding NifX family protein